MKVKINKLDLLLVNPPYERLKGFSFDSIPNGILGLASYINQCGFKALVYDADTNSKDGVLAYTNKNRAESQSEYAKRVDDDGFYLWKEIRETIKRFDPQFVGISLKTPTLHSGLKVAKISKELGKTVLAGGTHVNIVGEKILDLKLIDFAFFGEGEYCVLDFLRYYPDIKKLKTIRGLGFRHGKEIVYNGFAERIGDLDSLPFPDRELLIYKERYLKTGLTSIMASRGCPFKCTFCASVPSWGRSTVFRSPNHILEEIKYLHEQYGVREFRFFDDTFTIKKENVINLCKLLIEAFGEKYFSWLCLSHIKTVDENVLSWLKKAGCNKINFGVESGSERVLELLHKGITLKDVEKAVCLAKKYRFLVHTYFMIGIPYETMDDMKQTIAFIKKIKPDSVNLCTFTPYPGTELYDYCVERNLFVHDDSYSMFKYIGHHSMSNYFLEYVSMEDYEKVLTEMLELTTKITNSMTYKKLKYKLNNFTVEKMVRKVKLKCRQKSQELRNYMR